MIGFIWRLTLDCVIVTTCAITLLFLFHVWRGIFDGLKKNNNSDNLPIPDTVVFNENGDILEGYNDIDEVKRYYDL